MDNIIETDTPVVREFCIFLLQGGNTNFCYGNIVPYLISTHWYKKERMYWYWPYWPGISQVDRVQNAASRWDF